METQYKPDTVSSPGKTLLDIMQEVGIGVYRLAQHTGIPHKTITDILGDMKEITEEIAIAFEKEFGIPVSFWIARERAYRNFMTTVQLTDFLEDTFEGVRIQLEKDEKRWGDTWKHRPREGQEDRVFARFKDYYDQYKHAGTPINWFKVIGEAHIALVRECYPEVLIDDTIVDKSCCGDVDTCQS